MNHNLSSDSRLARNLRNLAEAARHFHSAASSTASTIRDHSGSLLGDFPAHRRERVETFIRTAGRHASGHRTPPTVISTPADSASVVTSPGSFRVSTSSPRWPVVEDDEDDDAEFEKHFLDGLEDLAKDSIRRREFEKAIGFLTEAIHRKEKAGSGKEDLPRLQTQLALCYLFGDDWEKAEPIVSILANRKEVFSYLGPMVWTMLHALALAYLSTYSFDGALKMCKRAFYTQGKWAKIMELDRRNVQGCAETTGLLATIFHMAGDYIAAEIYRRQLPEDFLYNHCSDPREYLSRQPDLLEDVLGNDLPDLCDYSPLDSPPDIPKLWINTQYSMQPSIRRLTAARKTPTDARKTFMVNGGDVSPLRARRRQWEKFEMDTSKEVVVLAPDPIVGAEDKAASTATDDPRNTTVTSGLRGRATRMFETGRGLHRAWGRRSVEADCAASSTPSPVRRWLKGTSVFAAKPVRTVLRKRPNNTTPAALPRWEGPKTFRGLPISRPIIADSAEWCPTFRLPVGHPATILNDYTIPEPVFEGHPTPGDVTGAAVCGDGPCTDTSQGHSSEGEVTPETTEVTRQPVTHDVAKPSKSSFSVTSQKQTFDQADSLDMLCGYLLIPQEQNAYSRGEKDEVSRLDSPTVVNFPKTITPENRPRVEKVHGNAPRTTADIDGAIEKNVTTQPGRPSTSMAFKKSRKASPTSRRGRNMLEPRFARGRANTKPTTEALTQEETITLSKLADILASLATRDNLSADKLYAARLELEALSAYLEKWDTDSILRYDLEMVIESLPSHPVSPSEWDAWQDSGYSSAGSGSSETLSSSGATSPGSEHGSQKSKPLATDRENGIRPGQKKLKQRFSLMARDTVGRSKSGCLQRTISHEGSPRMSSGPNRSKWRRTLRHLPEIGRGGKDGKVVEKQGAVANTGNKPGPTVAPSLTSSQPDVCNFF